MPEISRHAWPPPATSLNFRKKSRLATNYVRVTSEYNGEEDAHAQAKLACEDLLRAHLGAVEDSVTDEANDLVGVCKR